MIETYFLDKWLEARRSGATTESYVEWLDKNYPPM